MTTKVLFSVDKKLKEAAMRKAKRQGLAYADVLRFATHKYVNDEFSIDAVGEMIARADVDYAAGRAYPEKIVRKRLGLKPYTR